MRNPKVSVIIPVYNAQQYICQCLDSLLNQTLEDIEIICVDDESTDDTGNILLNYAEKDNRIKVIQQPNGGAGAARNTGMKYAGGKYLSILDSDDFYRPQMLEKAYLQAERDNADIVVYRCDNFNHSTGKYTTNNYSVNKSLLPDHMPFAGIDVEKDIFKLFVGWSWDKLFKTEFVMENKLLFQEQRTTNDMLFVFSAIVKAERIAVIDDVLVHHREAEGTLSVTRERSWHCFYDALIALKQQLIEWNLLERFRQDYINYCVHFSLWNLNTLAEPTRKLLYNKLREEWFENMGVLNYDIIYFYNKYEYWQFINLTKSEGSPNVPKWKIKIAFLCEKAKAMISLLKTNSVSYVMILIKEKVFKG